MAERRIDVVRKACVATLQGAGWVDIKTLHNIVQNLTRGLPKAERFGTDIRLLDSTLKGSTNVFDLERNGGLVTWVRLKPRRRR